MLTTEQKINLLILAEFEPVTTMFRDGLGVNATRIPLPRAKRNGRLLWRASQGYWNIHCGDEYDTNTADFQPSTWEHMQLDTCPDELIYEAVK